ncbi:ATP-binding cassette domain-containing protein [Glaciecola sp. XM2]|uniref:ATP-binding cassette domain-containing protein n=1 Tax=Glaciecola sp. XM2 TaxID=1914931 RepID=UPI001BDE070B|nr:ATP-binding cassette domain-containing protein [Glaciecola sp. XM2]MBT1451427.1 ATP-binding cassette domain-containing protein [Glaciecola sp. XM2]
MIRLQDLSLFRGIKPLLENVSLDIFSGQKVAIIGRNGCGKSSLFAMLLGEFAPDAGSCEWPKGWQVVSVAQNIPQSDLNALEYVVAGDARLAHLNARLLEAEKAQDGHLIASLHDELAQAGAYDIEARAATILAGLGFTEDKLREPLHAFSGGWQMRLNLARALLCPSDLLLLDEPTNHLDLDAVIWLESWLQQYSGTLLLISHDKTFIDNCANQILSFENKALMSYTGGYSAYEKQRALRIKLAASEYEKQQKKREHLTSFITRFKAKASKAKQAQSRVKQLEKMQDILPLHQASGFSFEFKPPKKLPNPLIKMEEVQLGYGQTPILNKVHLNLVPGSRIGLLGKNGAGKSTLIKLMSGALAPLAGEYMTSAGLHIGYFAQHQVDALDMQASPFDHIQRLNSTMTEQAVRDYLGGFGFHGDDALAKVAPMSGGEKARLVLAILVYQQPNLLLLDEPTNHLDIEMRQALNYALQSFEGAIVLVSHDRYLLASVCDDYYLVDDGQVKAFAGDLDDYRKWMLANSAGAAKPQDTQTMPSSSASSSSTTPTIDKRVLKRLEAEFRQQTKAFRDEIKRQETLMSSLSEQQQSIESKMSDASLYEASNKAVLTELIAKQAQVKGDLEEAEMQWLDAQESLEQAQAQFDQQLEAARV